MQSGFVFIRTASAACIQGNSFAVGATRRAPCGLHETITLFVIFICLLLIIAQRDSNISKYLLFYKNEYWYLMSILTEVLNIITNSL